MMSQAMIDAMPFSKSMGIELREAAPERIAASMVVRADLCTIGGALHGGAAMAMADALGAIGAFLNLPEGAGGTTTIESKTNFLGAAPEGATLLAETTPVHRGKRTSVWTTKISREDGKPVAMVTQTQMVL